jgi:hypothetical protein
MKAQVILVCDKVKSVRSEDCALSKGNGRHSGGRDFNFLAAR